VTTAGDIVNLFHRVYVTKGPDKFITHAQRGSCTKYKPEER